MRMNEQKFYELMGDIDPEIIAAADKPVPFRKKRGFKIALIAAVLAFAICITPIAGAFALVIGYNMLDPNADSEQTPSTEQNDGKPAGLIGELFGNVDWGAIKESIGKDGNVSWGNIWDALQGKHPEPPAGTVAFESVKLDDGTMKITKILDTGSESIIVIPDTVAGSRVTVIGSEALMGENEITSVLVPDTVTTIEDFAFANCSALRYVSLSQNLEQIGAGAFANCTSLTTVVSTGVAFTSSHIPEPEAALPESLRTLQESAFMGCTALQKVTIPASVSAIGNYAFSACTSLSEITLNDGLRSIGAGAFDGTAITEITIPATVSEMVDVYFTNCAELQKVTFLGDAPTVESTLLWYTSWRPEDVLYPYYDVYYTLGAQGFSDIWHVFKAHLSPLATQPYVTDCGLETLPFYAEITLGTSESSYFKDDVIILNSYKQFQAISKKLSDIHEAEIAFDSTVFEQFSIALIKVRHSTSEDIIGVAGLAHFRKSPLDDVLYPVITVDSPSENDADSLYTYIAVAIPMTNSTYSDSRVLIYNLNPDNQDGDSVFHDHIPDAFTSPD